MCRIEIGERFRGAPFHNVLHVLFLVIHESSVQHPKKKLPVIVAKSGLAKAASHSLFQDAVGTVAACLQGKRMKEPARMLVNQQAKQPNLR